MTGVGLFTFGVVATLPMGPAGINVAASALRKKGFPFKAFLGFLAAESLYLLLAFLLKDLLVAELELWRVITSLIAGVFIFGFGIHIIQSDKAKDLNPAPSGFTKSFMITMSNPAILLLHLTVLLQVQMLDPLTQVRLVSSFILGGLLTLVAIVYALLLKKEFFVKHGRNVEVAAGIMLLVMSALVLKKALTGLFLL